MRFLRPSSCGDGIKALLSLFDFQPPPITAGHWLIIVPLQSLGMALLTPPTPPLPLKVTVTSVCRTPDLWVIHHSTADWPSDSLSCWISSFYPSWGRRTSRSKLLRISRTRGLLLAPRCMNKLCAAEPEACSPSEVSVPDEVFSLHAFLPPDVWLQLWWLSFSFQTWSQTSAALLRPPWLPALTRISRATSGWLWRTPTCGRPSTG